MLTGSKAPLESGNLAELSLKIIDVLTAAGTASARAGSFAVESAAIFAAAAAMAAAGFSRRSCVAARSLSEGFSAGTSRVGALSGE